MAAAVTNFPIPKGRILSPRATRVEKVLYSYHSGGRLPPFSRFANFVRRWSVAAASGFLYGSKIALSEGIQTYPRSARGLSLFWLICGGCHRWFVRPVVGKVRTVEAI